MALRSPLRVIADRLHARRLRRTADADRQAVHLLMPYPSKADVRDRLADCAGLRELQATQLLARHPETP
jgi:hypothetical protein